MAEGAWFRRAEVPAGDGSRSASPGGDQVRFGRHLVVALVGVVLGQALIYHHAAPFAWVYALWVWRTSRGTFLAAAGGAALGTALGVSPAAAGLFCLLVLVIPLPYRRPGWGWLTWPLAGLGAVALFAVGQAWTWEGAILDVAVGTGAALLYAAAVREWKRFGSGEGDRASLVLFLTAGGALIAGLAAVHAGLFWPSLFAGGLLILLGGVASGPGGGALGGATLGITLALRGVAPTGGVGALVAAGFAAGWLERYHWRWGSLGLVFGSLAYAVLVHMPEHPTATWVSLAAAATAWQLVPGTAVRRVASWANLLWAGEDPQDLPQRLERLAGVMNEIARAFEVSEEKPRTESQVAEKVVAAVCRKCSLYRGCWERDFYRSYRALQEAVSRAAEGPIKPEALSDLFGQRCIRPEVVAQEVNRAVAHERSRADLKLRVQETRGLAQRQLRGVAELLQEMARDWRPAQVRYRARPVTLDYAIGIAKRPRAGGYVSGDTELVKELAGGQLAIGLSDGMGVGPRAAWESGTAVALAEKLLEAGFSPELVVRAVNSTLLLRSLEEEKFATLDLLVVDRISRRGEIVKVAAPPTFLVRRGQVEVVSAQSLPVGILPAIRVEPQRCLFEPGDVVVMVTDGVMERDPARGEERLRDFLCELPLSDAQVMAETILSFMLGHDQDGRDDATVAVVRILARGVRDTLGRVWSEVAVREWRRVTPSPAGRSHRAVLSHQP